MTKKTKHAARLKFGDGISIAAAIFIFALLLKNSSLASSSVKDALKLCSTMLIPSLFPMTVASEIMTNTNAIEKLTSSFSYPISKILGVGKNATVPYFLGLFGGYTSSCKSAVLLYQSGKISKADCESIIALSNIPSLAFMTGFIGIGIFESSTVGWILWIIAVFSTLILGILNNLFHKNTSCESTYDFPYTVKKKNISKIIVESIAHSAQAMLIICACVVFFSVLIAVLNQYFMHIPLPENAKNIILGAFEITKGISTCEKFKIPTSRAIACAFLVGWSGLCVHFQVIALCEDANISFKKYFIFKAIQAPISAALAWIAFNLNF